MTYEVGQQLWLVRLYCQRNGRYGTIIKVGRKLLHMDDGRKIDKDTLADPDNMTRAYLSKEDHDALLLTNKVWEILKQKITSYNNSPCSIEQIKQAYRVLFGELAEKDITNA